MSVIISSHILSEIQAVSERVIIINRGVLVADDTPANLSSGMSNDHSLSLRLGGAPEEVTKALSTVKGVKEVICLGSKEKGSNDYSVIPLENEDIRSAVSARIASRGYTIYGFVNNELTLEQIFLRLTELSDNELSGGFSRRSARESKNGYSADHASDAAANDENGEENDDK